MKVHRLKDGQNIQIKTSAIGINDILIELTFNEFKNMMLEAGDRGLTLEEYFIGCIEVGRGL